MSGRALRTLKKMRSAGRLVIILEVRYEESHHQVRSRCGLTFLYLTSQQSYPRRVILKERIVFRKVGDYGHG